MRVRLREMKRRTAADALRKRVNQICATADDELAVRAWRALSRVLFEHVTRRRSAGRELPIIRRTTAQDVEHYLLDGIDARRGSH
jgi:hypothetical protein